MIYCSEVSNYEHNNKLQLVGILQTTNSLQLVRSATFQTCMMVMVVLNAVINASLVHKHDASDEPRKLLYYYIEVSTPMILFT